MIPPRTPVVSVHLDIPTSTSSTPISATVPITSRTAVHNLLETLTMEFGLPRNSDDLAGGSSRIGSRSRSSSLDQATSNQPLDSDAIKWRVTVVDGSTTREISQSSAIMGILRGDEVLHVSLDEDWLFERTRLPRPKTRQNDTNVSEIDEEDSDTLKAARTTIMSTESHVVTTVVKPISGSARLSGIFDSRLETNLAPASPSSPELPTLVATATRGPSSEVTSSSRSRQKRPVSVSSIPVPAWGGEIGNLVSEPISSISEGEGVDREEWESFLVGWKATSLI